jgi:1,4-alpha-glucan branching enzyme
LFDRQKNTSDQMASNQGKYGKTFGAIPLDNGGVRFSVWSPNSQKVELVLFDKVKKTFQIEPICFKRRIR